MTHKAKQSIPRYFAKGKKRIIFASFSPWLNGRRLPTNGTIEPLRDYLVPKTEKFVLIDQPIPGSDFVMPRIEIYENQKTTPKLKKMSLIHFWLMPFLKLNNKPGTKISFKIRDFLSVLDWGIKNDKKYDLFIGLESINALAGILLRKIGRVKKVVYYISDYSPNRYPQKWFNDLYLWLDRFCAMHADYIWDVSKAMQPARIEAGLAKEKSAPEIHVPNGLYPEQIKFKPVDKVIPYSLVYMGTLGPENGPDLAVAALSQILEKFPQVKLHVIGGGEKDLPRLKRLAEDLKVSSKIKFYGYVLKSKDMSEIVRSCYLALAPYRAIPGSPRYYADAGKIRAYCASGVPVVTTKVPPLGKDAFQSGAALIVEDNANDLAAAIIKVFLKPKLYLSLRKKAIDFAKNAAWNNTLSSAFSQMQV